MVGMLQIITHLLCYYLVFKAVEIFNIGLASSSEIRGVSMAIGVLAIIASVALAIHFGDAIDAQAHAVASSINRYIR
jgi:hypothetical protein